MSGRVVLAALCCSVVCQAAHASPEDPRLRSMMRVTDAIEMGDEGLKPVEKPIEKPTQGRAVQVSYYCSKDTARQIGVTVQSVRGISVKLYDYDGDLIAQDQNIQRAVQRRADILDYKKAGVQFQEQVQDGDYYVAFCDVDQHQACHIPADRRKDPLDKDDGEDSIAVVGYIQSLTMQQGLASDFGQSRVLFDLPRRSQDDNEYDDEEGAYPPKGDRVQRRHPCDDVDSPLIIDLGNDGITLSGLTNGVPFDLDGGNGKETVAWPLTADDAFLAYDKNGNGLIDDGNELFGNHSIGPDGSKSGNGFLSLGKHDDNHDGKIDQSDVIFGYLVVWGDRNRNGVSDVGELMTLPQAGILEISLSYVEKVEKDAYGNEIRQRSIASTSEGARVVVDAWLRRM